MLGALFNVLLKPSLPRLQQLGVTPRALLDPRTRDTFTPSTLAAIGSAVSAGLLWVFVAMVGFAALGIAVSLMMSKKKAELPTEEFASKSEKF